MDPLVVDEWTAETDPAVLAARASGRRVTCLAETLLATSRQPVIGVTGSAGKTTTCHLIAAVLDACGRPYLMTTSGPAANAWPDAVLVRAAATLEPPAVVVAELTSTHLCYMESSPAIAVVTAVWPDHADLHGSTDRYLEAKRRILDRQRPQDVAVLNAADPGSVGLAAVGPARRVWFDGRGHSTSSAAAAAVGDVLGLPADVVAAALARPLELPFRFVDLGTRSGVRVIDDGMAATPCKAHAALSRLAGARVVWIGGGLAPDGIHAVEAEQAQLVSLAAAVRAAAWKPVLYGPAARRLADLVGGAVVGTLADAVGAAAVEARAGHVVLFSPAFPVAMADREAFAGLIADALACGG